MDEVLSISEGDLHLVFEFPADQPARLLHCSALPFDATLIAADKKPGFRILELQCTGENQHYHHGNKYLGTAPGSRMRVVAQRVESDHQGRVVVIEQAAGGLHATTRFRLRPGLGVATVWTELENRGAQEVWLEYVSSMALHGLAKEGMAPADERMRLHLPHNTWLGEAQWQAQPLTEHGLTKRVGHTVKRLSVASVGTWSSSSFLPMAVLENTETASTVFWQIEHNGSWHWELSYDVDHLALRLSGPNQNEGHWGRRLAPGERFSTVPVAIGAALGGFDAAIGALTRHRRLIRRPNQDNVQLPVIFNDYMNCLWGDPTTAKLAPLIDAAAEVGCEIFCIDCGWYADGHWWDGVGEWLPSAKRFPGGIQEPLSRIRARGMVPGLWLELEVMGINCPLATKVPDDWFFLRHGRRIIDHGRYQLDFRNPAVRMHADAVIERVVGEYGAGYIKMDYNINAGIGTETGADTPGDGLLGHNRAYLAWLDQVFVRHPQLIIEDCSSGGMRLDYALLARHSVLSSSDQTDYRLNAIISSAVISGVTPEQCAVWSYPLRDGDREEVIVNMVNALLVRIHQSGHLAELSAERRGLVAEGIRCYKALRSEIPLSLPLWPLGMPHFGDDVAAFALRTPSRTLVAVWRFAGECETVAIPLAHLHGRSCRAELIYPVGEPCTSHWNAHAGTLSVRLPNRNSARLLSITAP